MYYLRIEENNFGFVVSGIHTILATDIPVSNKDYNKFFELQSQGKQFRIKNPKGKTLFEILEEYTPVLENTPITPSLDERVELLELENAELLLNTVEQEIKVGIIEQDLADLMMEIATMKLEVE